MRRSDRDTAVPSDQRAAILFFGVSSSSYFEVIDPKVSTIMINSESSLPEEVPSVSKEVPGVNGA